MCISNDLQRICKELDNNTELKRFIFAAYNTKGVVNPAFGGSREVLIDMPPRPDGEVKLDMDGSPSIKPLTRKGDVKIDMGGDPVINPPGSKGDVHLDMDWDNRPLDMDLSDGNHPDVALPEGTLSGVDLPDSKLSGSGFSGGSLPGADADIVIKGPSKPTFNLEGTKDMVSKLRYTFLFQFQA